MASFIYESDLLELHSKQAQIIAQQCNCVSSKTKGLSRDILIKFPYADFYTRTKDSKPGTIKLVGSPKKGNRLVLAMFGQRNPGKPVEGDSFEQREKWFLSCLGKVSKITGLKSIAFPFKIGCGLAGGKWKNYRTMIDNWAESQPQVKVLVVCQDPAVNKISESAGTEIMKKIEAELYGTEIIKKIETKLYGSRWRDTEIIKIEAEMDNDQDYGFLSWVWTTLKENKLIDTDRLIREWNETSQKDKPKDVDSQKDKPIDLDPTYQNMTLIEYIEELTPRGWDNFFETIGGDDSYISDLSADLSKKVKAVYARTVCNAIYPPMNDIFAAFDYCQPDNMRVVIIGQDPYHNYGAAMGLAFSVPEGAKIQPSLRNIFKELEDDGFNSDPLCGDLSYWADQGVFLINTALTVTEGTPNSHIKMWKEFIRQLFIHIDKVCDHLVIIMWGGRAKSYDKQFSSKKHYKITGAHPSPINTRGGFLGTKPFSRTNKQLESWGYDPIDWNLVE